MMGSGWAHIYAQERHFDLLMNEKISRAEPRHRDREINLTRFTSWGRALMPLSQEANTT